MLLPNPDRAVIDPVKLHGYLLSTTHPLGRFEARFLAALGFSADRWLELDAALRTQHLAHEAEAGSVEPHGQFFTICAMCSRDRPARRPPWSVSGWFEPVRIIRGL